MARSYLADSRPDELFILMGTGASTFLASLSLGLYKLRVAVRTESEALYMDGVCSLNGALLSFSSAAAALVYSFDPRYWWSDLVVSTGCALWLVAYGILKLWRFRVHEWWGLGFWRA